ncbi:MAG: hypothetical protein LBM93_11140, partial [Oscillospiraceae bacterium]|jgi:hypothetical protein|nr:hypothetical protein [Oscillospiraceae bacterium]
LHGAGVVCGLSVKKINVDTIRIERGFALDSVGGEIVVSESVNVKLSDLTGFDADNIPKHYFLCLEYDEYESEPISDLFAYKGEKATPLNSIQNNYVAEDYKLYLSSSAPTDIIYDADKNTDISGLLNDKSFGDFVNHDNNKNTPIYLARINLVKDKNSYKITTISFLPFNQYVFGNRVTNIISEVSSYEKHQKTDGFTDILVNEKAKAGEIFFSSDIVHKLGPGNVSIILGVVNDTDNSVIFGSSDIHWDNDINVKTAAKVNIDDGTFQIGICLTKPVKKHKIRIQWTALKTPTEKEYEINRKQLLIYPSFCRLTYGEKIQFKAKSQTDEIVWNVIGKNSGTISSDGVYTAPESEGVYEVAVSMKNHPEIVSVACIRVCKEDYNDFY